MSEYASQVWNSHLQRDIDQLECVQKFVSLMCAKQWDLRYADLHNIFNIPSLKQCRNYLSLCTMYKILHNLVYFPTGVFVRKSTPLRFASKILFSQPYAHTNAILHSFVPQSCSNWNSLPELATHTSLLTSFKTSLKTCFSITVLLYTLTIDKKA